MEIGELDDLNVNVSNIDEDISNDIQEDVKDITDTDTLKEDPVDDIKENSGVLADSGTLPEGSEISEGSEEKKDETPTDVDIKDLSGIEQYLSKFSIEGGMIDFKDGSKTHFNELPSEKQVEVLSKLHAESTKGIEEKFGLDENEIGLINYLRKQDGTIDDVINELALQRAQTYISSQQVQDMDVSKMKDDEVYTSFLMNSNADITTEQLEQDLETAKKMSNYNNIVTNIRQQMTQAQESAVTQQKQESNDSMLLEIEDQRKQVVEKVSGMDSVDGLAINDGIKNDVLDLILNVDDDGDSLFMTDVFSDPEKLFKAAFWYKNGADVIATREDYWKKEKSAAYKRGLKDAETGKKTFTSSEVEDKNKTTLHHGDPNEIISFDDLYNT